MTIYNNQVNDGKEWGYFEGWNPYWVAHNEYLVQAASVHDIPVVRVDLAFNGPNLDEDPSDKDLLSDGIHPNAEGIALIADLFRELGYEPLAP
jgi:lysophospholipase L1-like esterase